MFAVCVCVSQINSVKINSENSEQTIRTLDVFVWELSTHNSIIATRLSAYNIRELASNTRLNLHGNQYTLYTPVTSFQPCQNTARALTNLDILTELVAGIYRTVPRAHPISNKNE